MNTSFYQYVLTFRGGKKNDPFAQFAEAMFEDLSFPKYETTFHPLSIYVEENVNERMPAIVFDELWEMYETNCI